jgi:hypothetical protein
MTASSVITACKVSRSCGDGCGVRRATLFSVVNLKFHCATLFSHLDLKFHFATLFCHLDLKFHWRNFFSPPQTNVALTLHRPFILTVSPQELDCCIEQRPLTTPTTSFFFLFTRPFDHKRAAFNCLQKYAGVWVMVCMVQFIFGAQLQVSRYNFIFAGQTKVSVGNVISPPLNFKCHFAT